ncbi:unnamed protein product [Adineta ricciae]|uniref:Uncharacterized protein n=1 Tax=Adineta ricciae TaxID=249248 RepID=A0A816D0B9_ADIRI|nr:unnamed protein product [Adineta ricciae]
MSTTLMTMVNGGRLQPTRPTTLLLPKNQPHLYNYWTLHDRLRLQNAQLIKQQQSSCRMIIYSLWLFIFSSVTSVVIYRFTDQCSETKQGKILFLKCLRYWLLLVTIGISVFTCCGVIFGAGRYVRWRPRRFQKENQLQFNLQNKSILLPMTNLSHSSHYSTPLTDDSPLASCRKYLKPNDLNSNTTEMSSLTNVSLQRKIPPYDYEELPNIVNSNKNTFLPLPRSSLLSSLSTETGSNDHQSKPNGVKSKSTLVDQNTRSNTSSISHTIYLAGVDVWQKQQRQENLSSFY